MKRKKTVRRRLRLRRPLTEQEIKEGIGKMLQPDYVVDVFYRGADLDDQIIRAAKRPSEGSGMFLPLGLRDLRFEGFTSEAKAVAVARRIEAVALPGVRVMIRTFRSLRKGE